MVFEQSDLVEAKLACKVQLFGGHHSDFASNVFSVKQMWWSHDGTQLVSNTTQVVKNWPLDRKGSASALGSSQMIVLAFPNMSELDLGSYKYDCMVNTSFGMLNGSIIMDVVGE